MFDAVHLAGATRAVRGHFNRFLLLRLIPMLDEAVEAVETGNLAAAKGFLRLMREEAQSTSDRAP